MRCGRTLRTSPPARRPSWPGSPRPTTACTGPTCSKNSSGPSSRSKECGPWSCSTRWLGWAARSSYRRLRRTGPPHPQEPGRHRSRPDQQPVQRPDRIDQHQDPPADPHGLRVPLPRSTRRPGPARPRRLLPPTPQQTMTAALRRPDGRLRLPYRPSGRCAPSGLVSNRRLTTHGYVSRAEKVVCTAGEGSRTWIGLPGPRA